MLYDEISNILILDASGEVLEKRLQQAIDLYKEAEWWDDGDTKETLLKMMDGSHIFIAAYDEDADEIVGLGRIISDKAADAYVQDIVVAKKRRGQGIAKSILRSLIARAGAEGLPRLLLIAERGTSPLYESVGFVACPTDVSMELSLVKEAMDDEVKAYGFLLNRIQFDLDKRFLGARADNETLFAVDSAIIQVLGHWSRFDYDRTILPVKDVAAKLSLRASFDDQDPTNIVFSAANAYTVDLAKRAGNLILNKIGNCNASDVQY